MGQQIMDIEVQNMHLKHSKISFEVHKMIFEKCFETKMSLKNILEVPALIPAQLPYIKQLFPMTNCPKLIKKNITIGIFT